MIGHAMPVYRGYASQYGHGLGNVLGGLVRSALPIAGKIAKSAGSKLLETGLDILTERLNKRKASKQAGPAPKRLAVRPTLHSKLHKKRHSPPKRHKGRHVPTNRHKADIFS
jgi:hypothetical protein